MQAFTWLGARERSTTATLLTLLVCLGATACGGGSSSPTGPSPTGASQSAPSATVIVKDVAATIERIASGVIYRTVLTIAETGGRSGATIGSIRLNLSNSSRSGGSTFDGSDNITTALAAGGSNLYRLNVTSENATDSYTQVGFTVTFSAAGSTGTYTTPASTSVTPVPAASPAPTPSPSPAPTPASAKYDGTYDFSFVYATGSTTVTTQVLPRFFIVRNGIVSSSDGTVAGTVTNSTFGNVQFTGPCPHGDSLPNPNLSAIWTGILNAGSGPKFGEGNYVCRTPVGTPARNTWRAYNGT